MTRRKDEEMIDSPLKDGNAEHQTVMQRIPDSVTPQEPEARMEYEGAWSPTLAEDIPEAELNVPEVPVTLDNPPTDIEVVTETSLDNADKPSHVTVIYRGDADSFRYGAYQFRPGQPAKLPSVIAEELLTYPFEKFEVKE